MFYEKWKKYLSNKTKKEETADPIDDCTYSVSLRNWDEIIYLHKRRNGKRKNKFEENKFEVLYQFSLSFFAQESMAGTISKIKETC